MMKFYVAVNYQHSQEWILDSSSTFHICPNREWFINFENINGGQVLVSNHMTCQENRNYHFKSNGQQKSSFRKD